MRTTSFREFNDAELDGLGDEELVAYIRAARKAGRPDQALVAGQILAFRHERKVKAFVYARIRDLGEPTCDEVVERALESAMKSVGDFEGETIEEFRGFLFRIVRRRIIDMHRERDRRPSQVSLTVGEGDDERERDIGSHEPLDAADTAGVVRSVFTERSERHRLVIHLALFKKLAHEEVAEEVNGQDWDDSDDPMTDQNVAKILSRFRKDVRTALDEAEEPPPMDDDD